MRLLRKLNLMKYSLVCGRKRTSILRRRLCTSPRITMIAAVDTANGIGWHNKLAWRLPPDLRRFKRLTKDSNVIMGRKTFESLGSRPLPNRNNIIITRSPHSIRDKRVLPTRSIDDAIQLAKLLPTRNPRAFVIGGGAIYREVYDRGLYDDIELTRVLRTHQTDTKFPHIDPRAHKLIEEDSVEVYNGLSYQYLHYQRHTNPEEDSYLQLLKNVMDAPTRSTRNSTTRSVFQPPRLEFDLRNGFPALTTKRIWVKGVLRELQWFLSGSVDAGELSRRGCKVWDPNTTREFLNGRGLEHFQVGEIGETYGFLFRHYGAKYYGVSANYDGRGFDQLTDVVDKIRNNPTDRRLIINLFKPDAQDNCALPPCMCWYQFYVDGDHLDLYTYIRSSDVVLGLPWNIVTGGLLVELIARITGLKARRLVVGLGDVHIYSPHVDVFKTQLEREARMFPKLEINTELNTIDDIVNLDPKHVKLIGYNPYPTIKADMIA